MGLFEGGITYRGYYVEGDVPDGFRPDFLERIRARRFVPLEVTSEADLSVGWVPPNSPLGTEFHLADLFVNQYLVLSMRMDRWAIPPLLLKARVREAEEALKAQQKREHLSRMERGELVDRERLALKKQTLPAARMVDIAWNIDNGQLRVGSTSRRANELFGDLFDLTFGYRLVPDSPYLRALHCGLADDAIGRLAEVEPERLG